MSDYDARMYVAQRRLEQGLSDCPSAIRAYYDFLGISDVATVPGDSSALQSYLDTLMNFALEQGDTDCDETAQRLYQLAESELTTVHFEEVEPTPEQRVSFCESRSGCIVPSPAASRHPLPRSTRGRGALQALLPPCGRRWPGGPDEGRFRPDVPNLDFCDTLNSGNNLPNSALSFSATAVGASSVRTI